MQLLYVYVKKKMEQKHMNTVNGHHNGNVTIPRATQYFVQSLSGRN